MSAQNLDYLKSEFDFKAKPRNPKGLDFRGLEDIRSMTEKINKTSLREHFNAADEMRPKSLSDFKIEVQATQGNLYN